jgi:AcrR family transcriptional regulator
MFSEEAHTRLPADDHALDEQAASPRSQAIARSLEGPRARSVERLERFLAAARDLANAQGSASFTVAQVTSQAGLSLKSFYRCFGGKDDLLVALLEEDSRLGAAILGAQVDRHPHPVDRLRAYLVGVFGLLTHPGAMGYARMLVQEHRRLSEERPDELRVALAPMVDLLAAQIALTAERGTSESGDPARDAQTIFVLVLEGVHDVALGHAEPLDQAEYLWRFASSGLGIEPSSSAPESR